MRPEVRDKLRLIWNDPQSLDPSRRRLAVTKDIAALLARLAVALEAKGHTPHQVALFLIRSIFCIVGNRLHRPSERLPWQQ